MQHLVTELPCHTHAVQYRHLQSTLTSGLPLLSSTYNWHYNYLNPYTRMHILPH